MEGGRERRVEGVTTKGEEARVEGGGKGGGKGVTERKEGKDRGRREGGEG